MKLEAKELSPHFRAQAEIIAASDVLHEDTVPARTYRTVFAHVLFLEQQLAAERAKVSDIIAEKELGAYGEGLKHCEERLLPRIAELKALLESRPEPYKGDCGFDCDGNCNMVDGDEYETFDKAVNAAGVPRK